MTNIGFTACPSCGSIDSNYVRTQQYSVYTVNSLFQSENSFNCMFCMYSCRYNLLESQNNNLLIAEINMYLEQRMFNINNSIYWIIKRPNFHNCKPTLHGPSGLRIESFDFGVFDIRDKQLLENNIERWRKLVLFA